MALNLELTDTLFTYFNLFVLLFCVTLYLVVAVDPCLEWIPIEKHTKKWFLQQVNFTVNNEYTCLHAVSKEKVFLGKSVKIRSGGHISRMFLFI